jgi:hypothetical protein
MLERQVTPGHGSALRLFIVAGARRGKKFIWPIEADE